jgi:hypothetical protein
MNRNTRIAAGIGVALTLAAAAGITHGQMMGPMMMGPGAMLTRQDAESIADMAVVHDLLFNGKIRRTRSPAGARSRGAKRASMSMRAALHRRKRTRP